MSHITISGGEKNHYFETNSTTYWHKLIKFPNPEFFMKLTLLVFLATSFVFLFSLSGWIRDPLLFISTLNTLTTTKCPETIAKTKIVENHEYKTNISHLVFGIGGSANTWGTRKHYAELWWKPNVTRGYVWLDEKPNGTWPENSIPYQVSENVTKIFKRGSMPANRIARIVLENYRLGLENVRWFVMGDDDTVFFTENLVAVLSKYDHKQMYYIGGISESVEQDLTHSYTMGYGGAGFAISYPLVKQLVKVLDGCIDRYSFLWGSDERVGGCLNEIGIPLTKELGFHQVDIHGDPYGLLAAHPVAPLVSLHHLDYLKPIFPTSANQIDALKLLVGAYKMDTARTLQQSFYHDWQRDWTVSVSWGYTVQIYPRFVLDSLLRTPFQTFQTWGSWKDEPFTFNTRPLSPDPCEQPLVYFLDDANNGSEVGGNSETVTSYKKFVAEPWNECNEDHFRSALALHTINITASKMDLDMLSKAPQRQCCEITTPFTGAEDNVIQIRIKSCSYEEGFSLPRGG
ncbi:hypothetical protein MKW94_009512 [Papaver nudicaule]|uniref:Uncharacterized protein n=1 Tax=Papaver nudicaule TaxID=74823 RepID=A0AA41V7Y8_PAPNU|nr:hypothetical protein [Papaver nudicaule]